MEALLSASSVHGCPCLFNRTVSSSLRPLQGTLQNRVSLRRPLNSSTRWARVPNLKSSSSGDRRGGIQCMLGPEIADAAAGLVLGVGVGLPCHVMDCGDIIYRSTLPQSDAFHLTGGGVALAALVVAYLWATPGVAPGFWDMFVLAPLEERLRPSVKKEDLVLGKKLGEGAYGSVFRATYSSTAPGKPQEPLVVKRANEFGAVEIWMNERVRRACPGSCADFIQGFLQKSGKASEEFWLVWRFEGDCTLADVMANKDFPYNVEEVLLGKGAGAGRARSPERENRIVAALMQQLLRALQRLHSTGIVHRDIKPQNIIFSQETGLLKIIDLGAAADLRVGINYTPKEFLLDPRYAAPEQYIMSTQTPSAPPPPVAAALSPVLWQMNLPDRFDIYSTGLIFLQMAFPNLRNDSSLIQFNRQLKRCGYDLAKWRESVERRGSPKGAELARGFELLELDGGVGWALLQSMVRFKGRQRISAGGALAHPYFHRGSLPLLQRVRLAFLRAAYRDNSEIQEAFLTFMARTAVNNGEGFTEAQLQDFRDKQIKEQRKKASLQRNALASMLRAKRKVIRTINTNLGTVQSQAPSKGLAWWNRWQA